ncbi:hypothetical protein, partial [Franconibacter helveticus]|uniref:hypothetical protein n=1 Tax=Franconibacter helveticus TaxID=357240 RepID=UPI001F3C8FD4
MNGSEGGWYLAMWQGGRSGCLSAALLTGLSAGYPPGLWIICFSPRLCGRVNPNGAPAGPGEGGRACG